MKIKIRKAKIEDCRRMAHVHRSSIRKICSRFYENKTIQSWSNISTEGVRRSIRNPSVNNLVAEVDSVIVGVAASYENNIWLLYVHPQAIGRGIGEKLLNRLEKDIHRKGITKINLTSSLNAYNFYLRNGYEKVRKKTLQFRDGTRVPSIIMIKTLI